MTGRASGGPSRGAGAPTRTSWTRDGVGAILAVLGARRSPLRLIIAYVFPGTGLKFDLDSFHAWAANLARNGLNGFYNRGFFLDYTPGYLYVLWLVGLVGQATGGIGDLIKIPPILADVAIGWLVWSMARSSGASRRAALIGAALVVVNPVTWFDSVDVGPGRLVRRRVPAARAARAVARPAGAGGDLDGDRGAHQAPARDPRPDRRRRDDPARALADGPARPIGGR